MGYRILIADDDLHTRRILETLLGREPALAGPEIVGVSDGQAALGELDKAPFDLVITDLLMPRLDGFALARALRQHRHGQDVPLLVTSAVYKDRTALGRLQTETRCEFFAKPFELRDMIKTVLRLLVEPKLPKRAPRVPGSTPPAVEAAPRRRVDLPRSGDLGERAPGALLLDLFDDGSTGVLTLTRGRLRKEVYVLLGHPIGADSNLRSETLGQVLLARGAIDPARLQQALDLALTTPHQTDRLGGILVEKGWIKESDLLRHLAAQVRLRIVSALRWRDGSYSFAPGDTFSGRMTHHTVDTPQVLFAGLKGSAAHDDLVRELLARGTGESAPRLVLDARFERHRDAFQRVFGGSHVAFLAERPRTSDVVARRDSELVAQADALLLAGLAKLEQSVATDTPTPRPRVATPLRPVPPLSAPSTMAVPRAELRSDPLFDDLFGEADLPPPVAPAAPSLVGSTEDSGVFTMPAGAAVADPDPERAAARDALLREFLAMPDQDHYQVLRVERTATAADVDRAYANRSREFALERFQGMDLGRDHVRLEGLHLALREAHRTLRDPQLRAAYDRTLDGAASRETASRESAERTVAAESESHFREGCRQLSAGSPGQAVGPLEEAVRAAPDQADYHAFLAWARFQAGLADGEPAPAAASAWSALEQAFAIDPDHAAAHEFAGRISFALGDDARAGEHLERALAVDPSRTDALAAIEAVYLRRGEQAQLERLYRALIQRLGDARAAQVWWKLAMLREQLRDVEGALAAVERYAELAPEDTRATEALMRLGADPERSRDTQPGMQAVHAHASLRAAWRTNPSDPNPGRSLFRIHVDENAPDLALAVAAALVVRGAADDEAQSWARRYRPRFLQRAVAPLAWAQFDAARHPDDDRDLAALFTRVFAAAPPPLPDPAAGALRLSRESLPPPFAQVLGYAAGLLAVAPPDVVRLDDARPAVTVVAGDPPALRATGAVLATPDRLTLAFHLGRALAALYPARALAAALPAAQLKAWLAAATVIADGATEARLSALDPDARAIAVRLAAVPPLAEELRPLVDRLAARNEPINLSRWVRGLQRTAERVGLIVCNDLPTAARILQEESPQGGAAVDDLVDFWLGEEAAAVRQALGLALSV